MIIPPHRTGLVACALALVAVGAAAGLSADLSNHAKIVKVTPSYVTEGIPEETSTQFTAFAKVGVQGNVKR